MSHTGATFLKSLAAVVLLFTAQAAAAGKVVDATQAGAVGDGATSAA